MSDQWCGGNSAGTTMAYRSTLDCYTLCLLASFMNIAISQKSDRFLKDCLLGINVSYCTDSSNETNCICSWTWPSWQMMSNSSLPQRNLQYLSCLHCYCWTTEISRSLWAVTVSLIYPRGLWGSLSPRLCHTGHTQMESLLLWWGFAWVGACLGGGLSGWGLAWVGACLGGGLPCGGLALVGACLGGGLPWWGFALVGLLVKCVVHDATNPLHAKEAGGISI